MLEGVPRAVFGAVSPLASEAEFVRNGAETACRVVIGSFSALAYSSGQIGSEERRALVPAAGLSFKPAPGDILRVNSRDWFVVTVDLDPASAVWRLRIR